MLNILSMGWGIQSFTIALLSIRGIIPPIEYSIFSDTGYEYPETIKHKNKYESLLINNGIKVINTKANNQRMGGDINQVDPPAFTYNKLGKRAQLRRQCTQLWKIRPVRKIITNIRDGNKVNLIIGFSYDEQNRIKPPDRLYLNYQYPLIDLGYSRLDCINWLLSNGYDLPGRSRCYICPYQNIQSWNKLADNPELLTKAIIADENIRLARPPIKLYLHPKRKPLIDCIPIYAGRLC